MRAYFDQVDKIVGVKKDCSFNTVVVGAMFDIEEGKWNVRTEDGRTAKARFLILGTGFVSGERLLCVNDCFLVLTDSLIIISQAARRYIPDWPGMENYKGVIYHSLF